MTRKQEISLPALRGALEIVNRQIDGTEKRNIIANRELRMAREYIRRAVEALVPEEGMHDANDASRQRKEAEPLAIVHMNIGRITENDTGLPHIHVTDYFLEQFAHVQHHIHDINNAIEAGRPLVDLSGQFFTVQPPINAGLIERLLWSMCDASRNIVGGRCLLHKTTSGNSNPLSLTRPGAHTFRIVGGDTFES